ncbi:Glycosyltransferase involved in cell wall bisynthesis [Algoriphagus boritolerans DSM 17298 = JCM 18970]|uniref:Glycosyltransferase involved in cell wall bisynthesis n=2 Tax=Algoriphagus TaxID=246875 RepID=A0A1H6A7L7_9BACT|nr:Glycosyltransferase involved in cell wall bisynthesis [Algoriphagus boritolerans DSM 17298 = JCM 18970]
MGASSRLRTYQFLPLWKEAGYEVTLSPFFNDAYLNAVYAHRKPNILNVVGCYFRRLGVLLTAFRYELIWIEKEAFPFLPSYAEWILEKSGKGYVVDYDDAVFHNYDQSPNWLVRTWMGDKIDWVMRHSRMVFAGNTYLQDRAILAGAKSVTLLPTVIQPTRYRKKAHAQDSKPVTIGWIGSPTTLKYLLKLKPLFKRLAEKFEIEVLIVNAEPAKPVDFDFPTKWISWSEAGEVEAILMMDIGIMPLPDNKWERGKCAYKLIQYMACGLPVVASPVGMNVEVVSHGKNGFLARDRKEWEYYLGELIQDSSLRKQLGDEGFELVQQRYTISRNFEVMKEAVRKLLG